MGKKGFQRRAPPNTSWDAVANWYDGWVGEEGSEHHRRLAIPAVLELLEIQPGEKVLDLGAGQGVLAPHIAAAHADYTGIEGSPALLQLAQKRHSKQGRFLAGDTRKLNEIKELTEGSFDAAIFLLSIQDMSPLRPVLQSTAWALRPGGRVIMLMTHPCFRIPRQSGWGWDENRKLRYRRIDHYLTALHVPMKSYEGTKAGVTRSFHRPLEEYINGLAEAGLLVDSMKEIPTYKISQNAATAEADNRANQEIPLFLGLRARKIARL